MKIECEKNPQDLVSKIGDPYFCICDDTWDEIYRHPNHPFALRITDCEGEVRIDVESETSEETKKIAENLIEILNQSYAKCDDKFSSIILLKRKGDLNE